ncbi:hypothetical protein LCGC14_1198840 [marine sediment metagenome]|uniref:Uncharacterized protein n=1 Tax=marine sediment metagenome TaxID=412755 RepID=A0A0F9M4X1_9ZZZZ
MASSDDKEFQLFDSVRKEYGTLLADFKEDERFIRGEYGKEVLPLDWEDQGMKEPIKFPTITDAIDNASDHILTTPDITVPIRPTETNKEHERDLSEDKRWFLDMFWDHVFQNQGDPLGRLKRSIIKGKGVLKVEIDWLNLPVLPDTPTPKQRRKYRRDLIKAAKDRFLWKVSVVPKATVFEDKDNPHDPSFVFESFQITAAEALRRFPDIGADIKTRDPMETVDYLEYWSLPHGTDPGKYIQWVEGERTHAAENPYSWETSLSTTETPDFTGYIPYAIGDPGWGDVDEKNNPFDRYVSLTRYMRSTTEAETRQATVVEMALRMGVFKILKTRNMPEVADGSKQLKLGPGQVWDTTDEQEIDVLDWGEPVPLSVMQWLSKLQDVNDRHSKFGALGGTAQRGVDTATEADQNSRNAATKLSGPINAIRRMIMQVNAWVLQDIPFVLEAPVTIFGGVENGPSSVTLFPRDLKRGPFLTNVQLETSDEAALKLRDFRTWIDGAQAAPISWKTAMKMAGINNPQEEMNERMIEDLGRSPEVTQLLLSMVLAVQQSPEAAAVLAAFQQNMVDKPPGQSGGSDRSAALPASDSQNPVEALRQDSRNDAIQNAPERSFQ